MTTNFYSYNSRPFPMVRSSSPGTNHFFVVKGNMRHPKAKDSRPMQKIIMKQMDQSIDYKLKLMDCGIEIQKDQWMRKIQRLYGESSFNRGRKVIVKDLDKVHISGRDILAVNINDFDRKPRYALSSTPLKSYSQKNLAVKNPESLQPRRAKVYSSIVN